MNIKYFKYNALHDSLNQIKGTCISQSSGLVTEVKYKIKYTGNRWNFSDINNIVWYRCLLTCHTVVVSPFTKTYANHIVNCTIDVCFVFETLYICLPFLF